jgi:5-formyltetrahydrofolate cyclo-ligase
VSAHLEPAEQRCWQRYLRSLPRGSRPTHATVTAGRAGTPEIADELLGLYLSGRKTAGSSLVADFTSSGDPLPQVGDSWICLDSSGRPGCILETTRVEVTVFDEVPASVARAEGEGDGSLEHWRRVHRAAWEPHLATWGIERIEEAEVVTEFFALVFREPADP